MIALFFLISVSRSLFIDLFVNFIPLFLFFYSLYNYFKSRTLFFSAVCEYHTPNMIPTNTNTHNSQTHTIEMSILIIDFLLNDNKNSDR